MASTAATLGEMRIACLRNCTSGSVYSCEASDTSSTAWADDSAESVASAFDESSPPTPGESTSLSPPLRISRGSSTSAETMRRSLPGLPRSDTYSASSSSGHLRGAPLPRPAPSRRPRRCTSDPRRGLLGVPHRRRHAGGDVVVDRACRRVHEGVDELALALLELADDDDAHVGIEQPRAGLLEALGEVGAAGVGGELAHAADDGRHVGCLGADLAATRLRASASAPGRARGRARGSRLVLHAGAVASLDVDVCSRSTTCELLGAARFRHVFLCSIVTDRTGRGAPAPPSGDPP